MIKSDLSIISSLSLWGKIMPAYIEQLTLL